MQIIQALGAIAMKDLRKYAVPAVPGHIGES
jgi:hypothetical protein